MHSRKLKPPTKTQILIAFWNFIPPIPPENELLDSKIEKSPTCCKFENLKFSKKLMNFQNTTIYVKKKDNFWNQIFENSRKYGNFENDVPPPPT